GRPGRAAAVVLAGTGHPGLRLLPGRPPRAVAGRAGQLVVRQPPGDRDVFGRPAHRRHPAGLLPAVACLDRGVRGLRRRDAGAVGARHGGRGRLHRPSRLAGARAGLVAGLVFALVPSVSRFAQEVRFYALATLVATLATLLLLRALDRPSALR